MAYNRTTWAEGDLITATKLNKLETQVTFNTDALEQKVNSSGVIDNAQQLLSTVETTDKIPYHFRASGGGVDIGNRMTDMIVGGTIVWNQLVGDNTTSVTILTNEVYIIAPSSPSWFIYKNSGSAATTVNVNGGSDMAFNLTLMFGSEIADYVYGLEQAASGAGVAWFRSLFPKDYYEYKAGILMNTNASAHIMRDASENIIGNYPLDHRSALYGVPKLDTNNSLYYDGDTYESDGTVTRRYNLVRAASGFVTSMVTTITVGTDYVSFWLYFALKGAGEMRCNLMPYYPGTSVYSQRKKPCIQDGSSLNYPSSAACCLPIAAGTTAAEIIQYLKDHNAEFVYTLKTPTIETFDAYQNPQIVDAAGTEEYVDYLESQNGRDVAVPVGHETKYMADLRGKLEKLPDPAASNGTYVISQSDGEMELADMPMATDAQIKNASENYAPISPAKQHRAVFYGLATAAGDSTQSASSNEVGTYTDDALDKILMMLGMTDLVGKHETSVASEAKEVGDVFIYQGKLYEATSAIASGANITPGTNCAQTSIIKIVNQHSLAASQLAIEGVLPNNTILYDDVGLPSIMVRIPKMTYAELGLGSSTDTFPAFIVNGQEVPEIYISKYQNVVQNSRAYSLPARDPKTTINFDDAISACSAKGAGWHLMTRMEWALLAHWCKHNNCMPKGNNNYGKDISEEARYHAVPATYGTGADAGKIFHVLTGTGPLTWSHDGTHEGIWDLNGNVNEWVGGIRNVYGELQVLVNNNAADASRAQTAASDQWKCISAVDGTFITPDGTGTTSNAVRARWKTSPSGHWEWGIDTTADGTDTYKGCTLENVICSEDIGDAAKFILQALGLFKYDNTAGAYNGDYFYWSSVAVERVLDCGGIYANSAYAGVFFANGGITSRAGASGNIGFRSAFVKLPTT